MGDVAIRKLSRLGNEMHLGGAVALNHLIPGHYASGIVLLLLLRRCVDDWIEGDRFRRPQRPARASSINALAASLQKSYATTHRHVMRLIALGWVEVTDRGVSISNRPGNEAAIVAFLTDAHDGMIRLIEDIASDMDFPSPERRPVRDLRLHIVAAALDVWLIPYEFAAEPIADWTSKLVWITIVVANVRHITIDPDLSDRFAYHPTPDALRRPINVPAIARLAGLSYGTTFRHCRSLATLDVIHYDRGGWITVSRQLFNEDVDIGVRALIDYFRKRIVELAGFGLDTTDTATFYLDGRPPYASVD